MILLGNIGGVNFAKCGALKAAGGCKNCCSHQFPSFLWLLFTFHCLTICVSTARPIFLCRLSRFNTHKRTPRASRQPLPHERRELSALTSDSPLYSHLPPLITHCRFVTGSLAGCLCLSLSTSLSKKPKKIYQESLFLQREKRRFTVGCPDKQ